MPPGGGGVRRNFKSLFYLCITIKKFNAPDFSDDSDLIKELEFKSPFKK